LKSIQTKSKHNADKRSPSVKTTFEKNKNRTASEAFSRGQKNCRFLYPPLNHGERTIIPAPLKIFWQNILDFDFHHTCCAKKPSEKGEEFELWSSGFEVQC